MSATNEGIHLNQKGELVALVGRDATHLSRVHWMAMGLKMYDQSKGRMLLTRGATPKRLLEMAFEYTGKSYPNNAKGRAACVADLNVWSATMKAALPVTVAKA